MYYRYGFKMGKVAFSPVHCGRYTVRKGFGLRYLSEATVL